MDEWGCDTFIQAMNTEWQLHLEKIFVQLLRLYTCDGQSVKYPNKHTILLAASHY